MLNLLNLYIFKLSNQLKLTPDLTDLSATEAPPSNVYVLFWFIFLDFPPASLPVAPAESPPAPDATPPPPPSMAREEFGIVFLLA